MENFTEKIRGRCSILTVALTLGFSIITACSSSSSNSSNSAGNAGLGAAQNQMVTEINQSNVKETPKPEKQIDIFAGFKRESDYKTAVRPKMLQAGWQPARSKEGDDNCASDEEICKEYPELEAGPSSPAGDAIFRWKKGDKVVNIYTYDNQIYNRYEFEAAAKPSKDSDVAGKYEFVEIGFSGEHTLELKNNNAASFKLLEEDGRSTGTGSWNWDDAKGLLTVTLSIKTEIAGDEDEKPTVSKAVFQFKKDGKNLKIVDENWSPDKIYIGKIFKRI